MRFRPGTRRQAGFIRRPRGRIVFVLEIEIALVLRVKGKINQDVLAVLLVQAAVGRIRQAGQRRFIFLVRPAVLAGRAPSFG